MNIVRCLLFSLIVTTITQPTYAMQQNQQPDTKKTLVQLEQNMTRLEQATKELEQKLKRLEYYATIKTMVEAPATLENDEAIVQYLVMAIFNKDFNLILYLAKNIEARRFRYIINHIIIVFQKADGAITPLSVYDIAKKKDPIIAHYFAASFPRLQ